MRSLDDFAHAKLETLERRVTRRTLVETSRLDGVHVLRGGRKLVSFCCNDYLNLTHHPFVVRAACEAIERYGTGAAASRLVTGNHPLYAALEQRLARTKSTEAAAVFGSGYLANVGTIAALAADGDLVLLDSFAHACIHAGARLSGARVQIFRHNDVGHLDDLLRRAGASFRHRLIVTEHVFSMDGDLAPVAEMALLAEERDAWLMVDDAHGLGILPALPATVPLLMGTLSKVLASYGGYVCATRPVFDLLHSRARPFVYSTGLPPASVAAAIAALDLISSDPPWAMSPLARARCFATLMRLPAPESHIVPITLGEPSIALRVSAGLERAGFLVTAIRPPTVPEGTARIRLTFTASHTEADIARLADVLEPLLAKA